MTFTRPFKWWRHLHPMNIIGSFSGYGTCECGNSLRRGNTDYATSSHGGHIICKFCGEEFKDEIYKHNHLFPHYSSCWNKDCELHKNSDEYVWRGHWAAKSWQDRDYYGRYLKDGWGTRIAPND